MDIILIEWPFKYGPDPSWENCYCQSNALTHAAWRWPMNWLLNVDIDEYIYTRNLFSLTKSLNQWQKNKPSDSYFFYSYWVKPILLDSSQSLDFKNYQHRNLLPRNVACKYMTKINNVLMLFPHDIVTVSGLLDLNENNSFSPEFETGFFHYLGLTTNWRLNNTIYGSDRLVESDEPMVVDSCVIDCYNKNAVEVL